MIRSSNNLLRVFEAVSSEGPITLDEISVTCDLSRSAAFRALKKLESDNWIRTRLDRRSYVITGHADETIASALPAYTSVDLLSKIIKNMNLTRTTHVRLYQQTTTNTFTLLDDSLGLRSDKNSTYRNDFDSVQLCLHALQKLNLVVGSIKRSNFGSGTLDATAKTITHLGYHFCEERYVTVIPITDVAENLSIIVLGSKSYFGTSLEENHAIAKKLINELPSHNLSSFHSLNSPQKIHMIFNER